MKAKKRLILSSLILVAFLLLAGLTYDYWFWHKNYRDRVYPGVQIGQLDLGGLTYNEALTLINERSDNITGGGLKFEYREKQAIIGAAAASFDSDLSYPTIVYDSEATAKLIFGTKARRSFGWYLITQLSGHRADNFTAVYSLDENRVKELLKDSFPELSVTSANAYFSRTKDGTIQTNPETPGKEIDYEQALADLHSRLEYLDNTTIVLKTHSQYPKVRTADMEKFKAQAEMFINNTALTLKFEPGVSTSATATVWTIEPEKLLAWLSVETEGRSDSLTLDSEKIKEYLRESVAPQINQEPVTPRFMMQNGKVTSWQGGASGREVDIDSTAAETIKNFLNGQKETLIIVKDRPHEDLADNNFKIKEIIGTGSSRFSGSPANRRHNIKVGAEAVNGLLIKPGDEFSLVQALGEIDATTGYLPELVIKGNKTTPEYGGGLCQIGTTVFRAALASGLPITARRNHSYRVSYYEPAGTDATIYMPQPDLRFINDTGNYVLIQARIVQDDLYFDFWGVEDGRQVTTTTPTIYNIVKPQPTKIIATTDLKPGEKKCTESSHNGADAYFDYTVVYPEGATTTATQTRRFSSHYIPWQAVCLVGATSTASTSLDIASSPPETTTSSSSDEKAAE